MSSSPSSLYQDCKTVSMTSKQEPALQVKYVNELKAPKVVGQLMERLQGDFPAVPEILGNLVPHQVNPWIGASPEGADQLAEEP